MKSLGRGGPQVARMLAEIVPTMIGIVVLCFILLHFVPGDATDVLAAEAGSATAQIMQALRFSES